MRCLQYLDGSQYVDVEVFREGIRFKRAEGFEIDAAWTVRDTIQYVRQFVFRQFIGKYIFLQKGDLREAAQAVAAYPWDTATESQIKKM